MIKLPNSGGRKPTESRSFPGCRLSAPLPIAEPIDTTGVIVTEPELIVVQPPVPQKPEEKKCGHLCVICSVCGACILTILCLGIPP